MFQLPSRVILKTARQMKIEEVRKYLEPHLGKRVSVGTVFSNGGIYATGHLTRFGEHIGLKGYACGVFPDKTDEEIAGLFVYEDCGNGKIGKRSVSNYKVVVV